MPDSQKGKLCQHKCEPIFFIENILTLYGQFAKQTKNGKFRAYAKGCIELCDKSSRFAVLARTKLEEAPKDIKHLEILRPANTPTMKERYDMTIAKERRLEVASQPELSKVALEKNKKLIEDAVSKDIVASKDNGEGKGGQKKNPANKKRNLEVDEQALKNTKALELEDEVQEGIDWSESEPDSGDESE